MSFSNTHHTLFDWNTRTIFCMVQFCIPPEFVKNIFLDMDLIRTFKAVYNSKELIELNSSMINKNDSLSL